MRRSTHRTGRARPIDDLPMDVGEPRARLRRGGPRTPLPLVPLIAIAAGVGLGYVSQSAHTTQATYEASALASQQRQLQGQNAQLGDELARLESSERIVAAAQQLGMRPAGSWAYVASQPVQVLPPSPAPREASSSSDALQQLVGALSGAAGSSPNRQP
ncbi:MAG: hypothetical protein JOY80_01740 [Candidatus Dormibacteraeota bacterium]|nr:hypothetical protein [Candidatus Dormibacteraeota bacterium]